MSKLIFGCNVLNYITYSNYMFWSSISRVNIIIIIVSLLA